MVALKCPSCAANISIDDSREYGFCSYCGTKVQLVHKLKVVHSFEDTTSMDFESIRKLIDAEMYDDAQKKLEEITQKYPDNVDAWIFLAYVKSIVFKIDFSRPYMNTHEKARNYILNSFDNSIEMAKAEKLMGSKNNPLYNELKSKFDDRVKKLFDKMETTTKQLETTTKQLIQNLNNNMFLLEGFFYDVEADGHDSAFFKHNGNLMCYYEQMYYIVNSVNNGIISMSFDSYAYYYPNSGVRRNNHLLLKIDSMSSNSIKFSDTGLYWRKDTSAYRVSYENMIKSRKTRGKCICCGGEKGIFGCKNKCASKLS